LNADVSLFRIILYVRDVRKLAEFYRDTLGLSVVEDITEERVVIRAGHCELALHRVGKAFRGSEVDSSNTNSNTKLVMGVNVDLKTLRDKLIANGVPMRELKSYVGIAGPLCDGTDPEGNVFQLAQIGSAA
jgi:catechol-2,3-dioxygenase